MNVLFKQCYLVDFKLNITCGILLKLLVPVAFEVDGINQHQFGQAVNRILRQKILNFTCRIKACDAMP